MQKCLKNISEKFNFFPNLEENEIKPWPKKTRHIYPSAIPQKSPPHLNTFLQYSFQIVLEKNKKQQERQKIFIRCRFFSNKKPKKYKNKFPLRSFIFPSIWFRYCWMFTTDFYDWFIASKTKRKERKTPRYWEIINF